MLITILFSMAHCLMLSNSVERSRSESDDTSKLVSSAYLTRTFKLDDDVAQKEGNGWLSEDVVVCFIRDIGFRF